VKRDLVLAILVLLLGLVTTEWWAQRAKTQTLLAVQQYDDALQQVASRQWRRLAERARDERALRLRLEEEAAEMAETIEELNGQLASVTTVTITAPAETLTVAVPETVYAETGIREYRLDWTSGTTWVQADTVYSARHEPAPQDLVLAIYQRPDRSWWVDAELEPYGKISDMQLIVYDPEPTWWVRNRRWGYAAAGAGAAEWIRTGEVGYLIPAAAIVVVEAIW